MGLDKYALIMQKACEVDVSKDLEFQRIFNGFYIVRRNADWRKQYYSLFEEAKVDPDISFAKLLYELNQRTGNVEASFSSKLLATLKPEMPIWDRYVIQNLGIKVPAANDPERLEKVVDLYDGIAAWYNDFMSTDNAKECLTKFDEVLPDYRWLSNVKKIDFFLWSIR